MSKKKLAPQRQAKVDELALHLRHFVIRLLVANFQATEGIGLNPTDLGCLCLLLLHGPSPAGWLAEHTGLTTGAITGVIDRLEDAGFVARDVDQNDRRKVIVTPDTDRVQRELLPHFSILTPAATPDFYDSYSVTELDAITNFLVRLSANDA